MLFDKVVESLIRQLMYAVVGYHDLEVDYEAAAQLDGDGVNGRFLQKWEKAGGCS